MRKGLQNFLSNSTIYDTTFENYSPSKFTKTVVIIKLRSEDSDSTNNGTSFSLRVHFDNLEWRGKETTIKVVVYLLARLNVDLEQSNISQKSIIRMTERYHITWIQVIKEVMIGSECFLHVVAKIWNQITINKPGKGPCRQHPHGWKLW